MSNFQVPVNIPAESGNASVNPTEASIPLLGLQCFFCNHYIPPNDLTQQMVDEKKLAKMLKTVSGHLLKKHVELPQTCDPKDVHVCASCLETVFEIYEDHQLMLEVKQNINSSISKMEQVVIDAWLINKSSVQVNNSWSQLIDLTLESYRNKLMMMRQLRRNIALAKGNQVVVPVEPEFCSHTIILRDSEIQQQFKKARVDDDTKSTSSFPRSNLNAKSGSSSSGAIELNRMDTDQLDNTMEKVNLGQVGGVHESRILSGRGDERAAVITAFHYDINTDATAASSKQQSSLVETKKGKSNKTSKISPKLGVPAYANPVTMYQKRCKIYECETCGRPIKGNTTKLKAHMFSHKNDDERKAAIAAGEPGCSIHLRKNIGRGRRVEHVKSSSSKVLQCQICERKFIRPDLFHQHLTDHYRQMETKGIKKEPGSDIIEL